MILFTEKLVSFRFTRVPLKRNASLESPAPAFHPKSFFEDFSRIFRAPFREPPSLPPIFLDTPAKILGEDHEQARPIQRPGNVDDKFDDEFTWHKMARRSRG